MNRICPNHCYATDKDVYRCPRCGAELRKTGMSQEEIIKETAERQKQAWKDLNGKDFPRINTYQMREAKRKMDEAEKKYNYQLRKQYGN
jgi:uncharacterized protein with PIN domain